MAYKHSTASPAHTKAAMKYEKENTVQAAIKFNKKTDSDVIDKLNGLEGESKRAYIIRLIREDIARNQ